MTELPAFAAGMMAIIVLAAATVAMHAHDRQQVMRVVAIIAANWCAGLIYVQSTGDMVPWHFNIFIDSLSAAAVLWHPAGRTQGYIGLFYMMQIAAHIAFGARQMLGMPNDGTFYYDSITWLAWGQLVAVGAWCGGIWILAGLHRFWPDRHAADYRKGHVGARGQAK